MLHLNKIKTFLIVYRPTEQSVILYRRNIAHRIEPVYREVYLCVKCILQIKLF